MMPHTHAQVHDSEHSSHLPSELETYPSYWYVSKSIYMNKATNFLSILAMLQCFNIHMLS